MTALKPFRYHTDRANPEAKNEMMQSRRRPPLDLIRAIAMAAGVALATAAPAVLSFTPSAATLGATAVLGFVLVLLSAIDIHEYRLPDLLTLPLTALGIVLVPLLGWDDTWARILAAAVGFLSFWLVSVIFRRVRGYDGLGLGDAKLLAAAGAWVGIEGLASVVLLACLAALAFAGAAHLLGRGIGRETRIPFGPFLGLATWLVWLYGALSL